MLDFPPSFSSFIACMPLFFELGLMICQHLPEGLVRRIFKKNVIFYAFPASTT